MMGPSEELQKLIIDTLKADPDVAGFVGDRVIDEKRGEIEYPFIRVGPFGLDPRDADGLVASSHDRQFDVFSRGGGKVECGRICDAVKAAIHDQDLEMSDNALSYILATYRVIPEPDLITMHGVVSITAFIEQP